MNKKVCLIMLLFMRPITPLTENDLLTEYEDCRDEATKSITEVTEEIYDRQYDRDNMYYDEYRKAFEYMQSKDNTRVIEASQGSTAWIIIALIVIFVLLVVALLSLAKVIKSKASKPLLYTGVFFWLVYSTFFWASFSVQIKSMKRIDNFVCDYYRLVHNIIYGNDTGDLRYIGVRKEQNFYTNLADELSAIGSQSTRFNDLKNQDLAGSATTAYNKLYNFVSNFENVTTLNPNGVYQVPFSNQQVGPTINSIVGSEFDQYYTVASGLERSADIGISWSSSATRSTYQSAITDLNADSEEWDSYLTEHLLTDESPQDWMEERIRIAGHTIFVTNIVLWGFTLVLVGLAFGGEKYATILKGLIILCILLLLVVTLALLWYNWGNVTLSGLCGLSRKLLNDNRDVLDDINASDKVRELAEACVYSDDERTLTATETTLQGHKEDIVNYFDGITRYTSYILNQQLTPNNPGIPIAIAEWQEIQQGLKNDHYDVDTQLQALNDGLKCDGKTYQMTSDACTANGTSNCSAIYGNTFTAPSCVSNSTQLTQIFTNLKNYITDTVNNATNLISGVGNYNQPNTPAGALYFGRQELYDQSTTVTQVKASSPNTFSSLINANQDVQSMFDCRILRQQLFRINNNCYSCGFFLQAAIILTGIMIIFCFVTLAALLFSVGEAPVEKKQNYEPKPTKIYVETGGDDVVDINDNEKVPMS